METLGLREIRELTKEALRDLEAQPHNPFVDRNRLKSTPPQLRTLGSQNVPEEGLREEDSSRLVLAFVRIPHPSLHPRSVGVRNDRQLLRVLNTNTDLQMLGYRDSS